MGGGSWVDIAAFPVTLKGSGAFRNQMEQTLFFDYRRSTCHDVKENPPALPPGLLYSFIPLPISC